MPQGGSHSHGEEIKAVDRSRIAVCVRGGLLAGTSPQVILGRRYYVPKPSSKARASILATVAKLASEDAKKELPTEYGVSLKRITEALKGSYTNSTLRNYVRQLAADGDLIRVAEGIYRPAQRINTMSRINNRA